MHVIESFKSYMEATTSGQVEPAGASGGVEGVAGWAGGHTEEEEGGQAQGHWAWGGPGHSLTIY